ncbi:hypothetical protein SAY86_004077 [Trapa natans]|uniref:Uncharacterized protein n=1 Tax=Trapa natans TaxID=22666 RepID=A0AAN7RII7_TRANT|nr:hypothetical protein SAY86_004077 [Trapa natans]
MAGTDPQKQLLILIRDFAAEKSQGERRVASLKKRHEELRSELDVFNVKLEEAKHCRETAEQELKGCEVELALNGSTVQSLEARISTIQSQICAVKSDIEDLKLQQESIDLEKHVLLMKTITSETRDLQELTRQSSELEQQCNQLVEELQRKSICPQCQKDNVDALKDILQSGEEIID